MKNNIIILIAGLAMLAVAPFLHGYHVSLLTEVAIIALFAMSLRVLAGYLALDSLGHGAFFGFGAYATALLIGSGWENVWVVMFLACAGTTGLGVAFGFVSLRATGPYFLMITLALNSLAWGFALKAREITGGEDGLAGVDRIEGMLPWSIASPYAFLVFTVVIVGAALFLLNAIERSSFGLTLIGIRDSASRMSALGYNIWMHKFVALLISAFLTGLAGSLFVLHFGFVSPLDLSIHRSAEALVAVILGGLSSFFGPAIGAAIILLLKFLVTEFTDRWPIALGCVYIITVLFARDGVTTIADRLLNRAKK